MERVANYDTSVGSGPRHFKQSARSYGNNQFQLKSGTVIAPLNEPLQAIPSVIVEYVTGGRPMGVAWPGPNVNSGAMLHGHFDSALPGQQVLVGFCEGSMDNPAVVAKYPYKGGHNEAFTPLHDQPFTRMSVGPTDQILGSFTGAYIALRGDLPLPGTVEIHAPTFFNVDALVGIDIKSSATAKLEAGTKLTLNAGADVSLLAGTSVSMTAGSSLTFTAGTTITLIGSGIIKLQSALGGLETFAVRSLELNLLLTQLINLIAAHVHTSPGTVPANASGIEALLAQLPRHVSTGVKIT